MPRPSGTRVLNRHAIVLFLGLAAIVSLVPVPAATYSLAAAGFLLGLLGLLLDPGQPGARAKAAHLLQASGIALLTADAIGSARWSLPVAIAELGIALAILGVLFEMIVGFGALRLGIAIQALGDVLYVLAFALAVLRRTRMPSGGGWVFIALAGSLSVFAAVYNLRLQMQRLRNPNAGWRFGVASVDDAGIGIRTPRGETRIAWQHVKAVERLDGRHLILILPSPLPRELQGSDLPFEELRQGAAEVIPAESALPDRYGFILHEQELGRPLPDAEGELRKRLAAAGS